jgi:hypothetical protein
MILKCRVIFCENEHGTGDVCFPDIGTMDDYKVKQVFIEGHATIRGLRKEAKAAGWGRVNGGDFCPACMESM